MRRPVADEGDRASTPRRGRRASAPGVTWAELDAATAGARPRRHGRARVARSASRGVALGDGSGWLERALGPTGASLVGAEVVLADGACSGRAARAELLWALRGAGARLGVVTRLDLRLHPVGPVLLCGFLGFPRDRAARGRAGVPRVHARGAGRGRRRRCCSAPAGAASARSSSATPATLAEGEAAVAPLRALRPSLDAVAPNEYRRVPGAVGCGQRRVHAHIRGGYLRELSEDGLELAIAQADRPAAALSHVFLQPLGGALAGRAPGEMALRIPDAPWAYRLRRPLAARPALDAGQAAWVDGFAAALAPSTLAASPQPRRARPAGASAHLRPGTPRSAARARPRPRRPRCPTHGHDEPDIARPARHAGDHRRGRDAGAGLADDGLHALNGKGSVAPATRERVIAAARELDYRPSRAARALRTRRTGDARRSSCPPSTRRRSRSGGA